MKSNTSLNLWSFITGIVAIVAVISFIIFKILTMVIQVPNIQPIPISPVISQALQTLIDLQTTKNVENSASLPVRLKIPKIKVDAAFEYLGLTPGGAMDVPKGPNNVAWFDLGSRPGDIGSAVVAGHYGWKNNIPAVFDNLFQLKKGDKIYVIDEKGGTTTFVVTEIGIYDQNGDAANVFASNDGKAHLNLITCEGVWDVITKTRPNRLVIFTDKV